MGSSLSLRLKNAMYHQHLFKTFVSQRSQVQG
jgi:hypothetical protein